MLSFDFAKNAIASVACVFAAGGASAAIVSITTSSTIMGNHSTNLVINGSFETRAPGDPGITNNVNWSGVMGQHIVAAQGNGAVYSIPAWGQTSSPGAYGIWGTLAGTGVAAPPCADGTGCVYFGNYFTGTGSANPAIFHADGTVTYATPPVFTNISGINAAPTTLFQTLTGLIVGDNYLLDFWAAGEDSTFRFASAGVFGLDIGSDSVFLTAPSPASLLAASSIRYGITFKANSTTETLRFTNWGHITTGSTELVLDDVILNHVPEPNSLALGALAVIFLLSSSKSTRALTRSEA